MQLSAKHSSATIWRRWHCPFLPHSLLQAKWPRSFQSPFPPPQPQFPHHAVRLLLSAKLSGPVRVSSSTLSPTSQIRPGEAWADRITMAAYVSPCSLNTRGFLTPPHVFCTKQFLAGPFKLFDKVLEQVINQPQRFLGKTLPRNYIGNFPSLPMDLLCPPVTPCLYL